MAGASSRTERNVWLAGMGSPPAIFFGQPGPKYCPPVQKASKIVCGSRLHRLRKKYQMFVGRAFRHDIRALISSGVLTPEGLDSHFSAACLASSSWTEKLSHRYFC